MPAGEGLKEKKLEHFSALIRRLQVVKALPCNHNSQEEGEREEIGSTSQDI